MCKYPHEFPREEFEQNGVHILTDEEFDAWLRKVNDDIQSGLGKRFDTEAALAEVKRKAALREKDST